MLCFKFIPSAVIILLDFPNPMLDVAPPPLLVLYGFLSPWIVELNRFLLEVSSLNIDSSPLRLSLPPPPPPFGNIDIRVLLPCRTLELDS